MNILDTKQNIKPARTDGIDRKRSAVWERNHALIMDTFIDLVNQSGKYPTQIEVQKAIGTISLRVIGEHMSSLRFEPTDHPYRILTDDVIIAIWKSATIDRNPQAMKLWMQLMEGWTEKTEHNVNVREIPAIVFSPVERKN